MDKYERELFLQFAESKQAPTGEECNGFRIEKMVCFEPDVNFYAQDNYHMGQPLGSNIVAMFSNFESDEMEYLILIDVNTGRRIKIHMPVGEILS